MSSNTLKVILNDITAIYESLNELSDLKTRVLKDNDIKSLDSIMRQEDHLNKRILKLLQARDEYISKNEKLSNLEQVELVGDIERLKQASNKFAEKNELNQTLVQQSLYYVNLNLNMLSPKPDSDTYSPQNQKSSRKPNRVFMDSRV